MERHALKIDLWVTNCIKSKKNIISTQSRKLLEMYMSSTISSADLRLKTCFKEKE